MFNVLFTSAGRRVELLRAFRRAYESLGLPGNIIAVDIDPLAPTLRVADRAYIVPRVNDARYPDALASICRQEKVAVVFPLIDPDVRALAAARSSIEAAGARLAVVPAESVEIVDDKARTVEFFRRLGLPCPRSWLPGDPALSQIDFPAFVKPRGGSAAKNAFKVHDRRELEFFLSYVEDPIVQEFLPGPEITNDLLCDLDGAVLGIVSRRRIEVRWGEVAKGVTVYDARIAEGCSRIARALPAVGPITVQCMMKDGVPCFTEINGRFGGGVPLAIAAGADGPRWILARCAGIPIEIPPLGTYKVGLYITRFDDSFFLSEAQRDEMASHRI